MKLKTLVASLALQQIKEVGVVTKQEGIMPNIECTCKNNGTLFCHSKMMTTKTV